MTMNPVNPVNRVQDSGLYVDALGHRVRTIDAVAGKTTLFYNKIPNSVFRIFFFLRIGFSGILLTGIIFEGLCIRLWAAYNGQLDMG